jgi:hypothetical protein
LTKDVALLLKDFGVKLSPQELDSDKFLSKLDKPAVVKAKQKIGQLGDGSDYEAPAIADRRVTTTPRKRAKKMHDDDDNDDDVAEPETPKKRKPNPSRGAKAAAAKKQAAKK